MNAYISKIRYLLLLAALVLIFGSCADSIITECSIDDLPPPALQLSKFSNIQSEIFKPNCALSGCHTGANPQASLNLSTVDLAYSGLVNVNSLYNPSVKRVAPGSSANSRLIKLLKRTASPVMPPNSALSGALIDSISVWIDNGAAKN